MEATINHIDNYVTINEEPLSIATLREIAEVIFWDFKKVETDCYHPARPYLIAMGRLDHISDLYGVDSGFVCVAYFLANASGWRGTAARIIKKELNKRLKSHKPGEKM